MFYCVQIYIKSSRSAKKKMILYVHNQFLQKKCIQGKPFNITVIQVYAPTSNAEEADVEWFYEDLQDLLELTQKKMSFSL